MTITAAVRSVDEVREIAFEFAAIQYPGKTVELVLDIAKRMVGFTPEEAIVEQLTAERIRGKLSLAYWCDTEYHPERDDDYSDPKDDLAFWRTGIRVSPF